MTKSELFKAAHKIAKAYKNNLGGDYAVYLSFALKQTIKAKKALKDTEQVFKAVNLGIKKHNGTDFMMQERTVTASHGQLSFSHHYKLEKARAQLEKGQYLGKVFTDKKGNVCANVYSKEIELIAY